MPVSPFGVYLRELRTGSGKSLREVADALGISHVYLGEIERGRRRTLPEKYWNALVECVPRISRNELESLATVSEPLDPATLEGANRDVVVALARRLEEGQMPDALADQLLNILRDRPPK